MVYVLPLTEKRLLLLGHLLHFLTGVSTIIEAHTDACKEIREIRDRHLFLL